MTLPPLRETDGSLEGRRIESELHPGVSYLVERVLAEGGMGTAYLTRRDGGSGSAPVVIKVMRLDGGSEVSPEMVAAKEIVALGRLNESVPPTPFVVRYVDSGQVALQSGQSSRLSRAVPWVAIEYVHGGIEGTTLEDRVTYSVHKTGFAFDSARAAHTIRCLASGLSAVHAVGVLHRDLTPGNVLCCGFGATEIFKISDFGAARAMGTSLTFSGLSVGTLGYAAPESSDPAAEPRADVFSFAGVVYYLLTGQHYLDAENPMDAFKLIASDRRPSIMDHSTLSPELLARPDACKAIDATLAQASSRAAAKRPASADQLAIQLLAALAAESSVGPHSSRRLLSAVLGEARPASTAEYRWTVRSRPRDDILVSSAAWDTDGHAFALSTDGARFWNGEAWLDAARVLTNLPPGMRFTQRYEAGGWLVGGDSPHLFVVDPRGVSSSVTAPASDICFSHVSGRIDDLLVTVGVRPGQEPCLWTVMGRRWMKPIPLSGAASVSTLQRLDDSRWLVGGRLQNNTGFAAVYSPVVCELEMLAVPALRAFIAGASAAERSLALLAGSNGVVLRVDGTSVSVSKVPEEPDLSSVAVDILDREWVSSLGVLWSRDPTQDAEFRPIWSDRGWRAPFVSILADTGIVVAMTADGGIVEGRANVSAKRA